MTARACERNGEVTLPQLLHMQNSEDVLKKIRASEGRLAALLKQENDRKLLEELFLTTVGDGPKRANWLPSNKHALAVIHARKSIVICSGRF